MIRIYSEMVPFVQFGSEKSNRITCMEQSNMNISSIANFKLVSQR